MYSRRRGTLQDLRMLRSIYLVCSLSPAVSHLVQTLLAIAAAHSSCPQIMGVYEDAMTAMESAGATLVYFNMTPVFDMPGNLFSISAFEEPREISR